MWEIITSSPQGLHRVTMLPNLLTANRGARWSLFLGALYPICCLSASSASTTKYQGRLLSLSMEPGGPQEWAYGTSHSWKPPAPGATQSSVQIPSSFAAVSVTQAVSECGCQSWISDMVRKRQTHPELRVSSIRSTPEIRRNRAERPDESGFTCRLLELSLSKTHFFSDCK